MTDDAVAAGRARFAKRVFLGAAIYGIIVLLPQYLLEAGVGLPLPAPIARPEHFYGFIGVALVWQFAFLLVASDVRRYRPLMLIGVLEKLVFAVPVILLYLRGRVGTDVLVFGLLDLVLAVLFVLAFRASGEAMAAVAP